MSGFVLNSSSIYRIRSDYNNQYLSMSGGVMTMALYSDGDTNQQWRFNSIPGQPANYYIQNVNNHLYAMVNTAAGWTGTGYTISGDASVCQWNVVPNGSGVARIIYGSSYYLGFDGTSVRAGGCTNTANQSWTLTAVVVPPPNPVLLTNKNPLRTGYYRIRSFNSNYLLTMSNDKEEKKVYVSQQDRKILAQQKWYVTRDEETGFYTIQNSGIQLYLTCGSADASQGSPLVGRSGSPDTWCVQSVDPGVMFFIGLSAAKLSIGFSDYEVEDLSEVALEPTDSIPSQIWFFENALPLGQDKVYARRELDGGEYTIECCRDNRYLSASSRSLTSDTAERASKFTLGYISDSSPIFTLRTTTDTGKKYFVTDAAGYIELRTSSPDDNKQWVLLPQKSESKLVYYICQPSQGYPLKVISSRLIDDESFAFDEISVGQTVQMWDLHSDELQCDMVKSRV